MPCCWSNSLTSANVHTQVLEWLFERRNSLLHSQQQARERERGLSAARQEWVDMYWVHLGAPASMMHHPVARTGLQPPLHLHQSSLSPPLSTTSRLQPGGVPFQKKFFQLNLPFPTFTRRQYHFQREMLVDALPKLCLLCWFLLKQSYAPIIPIVNR